MSIVAKALVFATEHHQHQHRKGTKIPYMVHLLNVCKLVAENNCSDELLASALLHDIVEDTDVTIGEVETVFGKQVAEIVRGATELDKLEKKAIEKEGSWQSRKEHTIHFLQHEATTDQLLVSGADKLDNLRSIAYDHKRIGEKLWSRFNASKEQQAWYYNAIANILMDKGKASELLPVMGREMIDLCENVF
ncbi:MAG: bifunctional (p)ppGpp synthetase/guanosine-3',5'-bis(diphosphate) 3'-pyrophosphohydrolase [Flavobacterium sp.]|nr:bifunctional (p)ppGpp synthetase/guanosine-3',5'-bis(diphosphate) 3'-pyrophosphohydrolase [Pedobacter sp.]